MRKPTFYVVKTRFFDKVKMYRRFNYRINTDFYTLNQVGDIIIFEDINNVSRVEKYRVEKIEIITTEIARYFVESVE